VTGGVLAGVGAALGGAIAAGVGGGLGAVVGFAIAAVKARRMQPRLASNMALVFDAGGVELHSLGPFGTRPTGLVLAFAYNDVAAVELGENWAGVSAVLMMGSGARVELESGKRGIGAGREAFAAVYERVEFARA
jgi:hypothetical protein